MYTLNLKLYIMEWNEAPLPQIDIIDDEKILWALDNLEDSSQTSQLEKQWLLILWEHKKDIEALWYDIDLAKAWPVLYITSGSEVLNIDISNQEQLRSVLADVSTLLSEDRPLAISWDDNERSIYETSGRDSEILWKITKKEWLDTQTGEQINIREIIENNDYIEELYKFTQNVKEVPEEKWDILDSSIQKPWETEKQFFEDMGNGEDGITSSIEDLIDMNKNDITDYQD